MAARTEQRCQGDLGNEDDDALPTLEGRFGRTEVHLGLAAARHSVQEKGLELRRSIASTMRAMADGLLAGRHSAADSPLPVRTSGRLRVPLALEAYLADLHEPREGPPPRRVIANEIGDHRAPTGVGSVVR